MRFVDIELTQSQLDSIAAKIGGVPDSYKAVRGLQLVSLTVYKDSGIWDTVGINVDKAIDDIGLQP